MSLYRREKGFRTTFWIGLMLCLGVLASANLLLKQSKAASLAVSAPAATEILFTDDGTAETVISDNNVIIVNRLTPTAYPATLQAIRLTIPRVAGVPSPVGSQIRLVAFSGAAGTVRPSSSPTFAVYQAVSVPESATTGFVDFAITNPPTITSGDFYVGYQAPTPFGGVVFAVDLNGTQRQRAFASLNNGSTFSGPLTLQGTATPINIMIRAVVGNDSAGFSDGTLR